jgi:hypothetical protein
MNQALALPVTPSAESGDVFRSRFSIGGVSVEVLGDCFQDVRLVASLEPFRVEPGDSDVRIRIEWCSFLDLPSSRKLFDSGTTWRLYEAPAGFSFDFNAPVFGKQPYKRLFIDREFRDATLQMNRAAFDDFPCESEPLEYPLDELLIMHRLTQERAIELHGAGIVRANGVGNLFIGHSGAGKSTTTRMWMEREEVEILSDDRIIVCRDPAMPTRMRMYGTPWHGEAMFASPGYAPLTRIVILQHGKGNLLTRLPASAAVAELFARSFVPFHRHEYVDSALTFLEELVEAVPVYMYAFEPDQRAVDAILNLHD